MTSRSSISSHVYRLVAPRRLEVENETIGMSTLEAGELVCRTQFSAISPGTELAAYNGLPPLRPTGAPYPRYLGYMNVAEVELAGVDAAHSFPPGTLVYTHAAHRSAFRIGADTVLAVVPDGLAGQAAAPAYLYRLAWNALRRAGMRPGLTVAVLGLGAIGLAAVQLVRHLGGACIAVSSFAEALSRAESAGAQALARPEARLRAADDAKWNGGLAHITISTTNGWDDWQLALGLTRFNGAVSVLGFPGRSEPAPAENPLASRFFYDRQLRIVASGFAPDSAHEGREEPAQLKSDLAAILGWTGDGALDPGLIIDRTVDASNLPELFREMSERRGGPGTVVLDWTSFRPTT